MPSVPLAETSTVAVAVPELDQDRLTMIDTIDQVAEVVAMMMIGPETEARAVIVTSSANARLAPNGQRANHLLPSRQKMNVTGGLSLCSSLLLG